MKHLLALLLLVAALAFAPRAEAFSLSLEPSTQTISVGDSATYTLRAIGVAEPIIFYTLNITFDSKVIAFQAADFLSGQDTTFLDNSFADVGFLGLLGTWGNGSTGSNVNLANLTFIGTGLGTSGIDIAFDPTDTTNPINPFFISVNSLLEIDSITNAQATVVPEPSTIFLLGAGFLALGAAARRRRG